MAVSPPGRHLLPDSGRRCPTGGDYGHPTGAGTFRGQRPRRDFVAGTLYSYATGWTSKRIDIEASAARVCALLLERARHSFAGAGIVGTGLAQESRQRARIVIAKNGQAVIPAKAGIHRTVIPTKAGIYRPVIPAKAGIYRRSNTIPGPRPPFLPRPAKRQSSLGPVPVPGDGPWDDRYTESGDFEALHSQREPCVADREPAPTTVPRQSVFNCRSPGVRFVNECFTGSRLRFHRRSI